ncbi:MAG: serine/threonine-protein kinase, partial [Gemmatimonadetes bacterium]|nr:serine/threonine-protein kinase [Gemmatimonadota bacterium]
AQLSHPHILPLFDSGEVDGIPYFVMPLVEGRTLRERMDREGALPVDVALGITRQVAAALEYAHGHGVVHRDIKPENILLVGREALVADFGIAVAFDAGASSERITAAGVVVGTPRYMSPEQAAGDRSVDARSDIYALGCVMYEMLTGQPPFAGGDRRSVAVSHALTAPPSPRAARREVSVAVDRAVRAAMAKNPADRIQTARALIDALSTPLPRHAVPAARRSPLRWGAGVVVVLAVATFGLWQSTRGRARAGTARRWVLVGDIEAPPGERTLGLAVRDLLVAELAQSRVLAVVPADQVSAARREASMPDTEPMSPVRAREIAARSAVQVIVTGRVTRVAPDLWAVMLQGISADDGHLLAVVPASAPAGGDALLAETRRVVHTLANDIGTSVANFAPDESPPHVSTPSFAAFRKYSDATRVIRSGDYDATVALLREAVALDTGFASAWAMMGLSYVGARQRDSARVAFRHALGNASRLTESEAHRLRGDVAAAVDGDLETAVRAYDRFLDLQPESVPGRANRALYLSSLGRDDEALAEFARAASIDPLGRGPGQLQLLNLAAEYVVVGRLDSARVYAARLRGSPAQYLEMLLLNATGAWDSLSLVAERYASAPSTERFVRLPAALHAAGARAALGDARAAEEYLVTAMQGAPPSDLRWLLHGRLLLDLGRGVRPAWPLPGVLAGDTSAGSDLLEGIRR